MKEWQIKEVMRALNAQKVVNDDLFAVSFLCKMAIPQIDFENPMQILERVSRSITGSILGKAQEISEILNAETYLEWKQKQPKEN